jgi:MOSC domain-containing protein YiiM
MAGKLVDIRLNVASGQPMDVVDSADVILGTGIDGDRHAKAGSDRQILVMDREVINDLGLEPGQIRENLTVEGIDLFALEPGQQLTVGGNITFEVGDLCDPCSFVESIQPGMLDRIQGKRGLFVTPLSNGTIRIGDEVVVRN